MWNHRLLIIDRKSLLEQSISDWDLKRSALPSLLWNQWHYSLAKLAVLCSLGKKKGAFYCSKVRQISSKYPVTVRIFCEYTSSENTGELYSKPLRHQQVLPREDKAVAPEPAFHFEFIDGITYTGTSEETGSTTTESVIIWMQSMCAMLPVLSDIFIFNLDRLQWCQR